MGGVVILLKYSNNRSADSTMLQPQKLKARDRLIFLNPIKSA
jgi:hypothetical protein